LPTFRFTSLCDALPSQATVSSLTLAGFEMTPQRFALHRFDLGHNHLAQELQRFRSVPIHQQHAESGLLLLVQHDGHSVQGCASPYSNFCLSSLAALTQRGLHSLADDLQHELKHPVWIRLSRQSADFPDVCFIQDNQRLLDALFGHTSALND
jgi:hypothetical protein